MLLYGALQVVKEQRKASVKNCLACKLEPFNPSVGQKLSKDEVCNMRSKFENEIPANWEIGTHFLMNLFSYSLDALNTIVSSEIPLSYASLTT